MGMIRYEALRGAHNALQLQFTEIGDADFVWHGRNRYLFNRIFVVHEGRGTIENHTAHQKIEMLPGHACFMPAGLDLEFDFPPGLHFMSFHFQLEILPGIDLFRHRCACRSRRLEACEIDALAAACSEPFSWPALARLESRFWRLLETLCDLESEKTAPDWPRLERDYAELLRHIREHADAATTVAELARIAHCSPDTLSRRFPRDFGVTLKRFVSAEVIRKAARALANGKMPVKEVAARLNFGSEFYFSTVFRRFTGQTPSAYRAGAAGRL